MLPLFHADNCLRNQLYSQEHQKRKPKIQLSTSVSSGVSPLQPQLRTGKYFRNQ